MYIIASDLNLFDQEETRDVRRVYYSQSVSPIFSFGSKVINRNTCSCLPFSLSLFVGKRRRERMTENDMTNHNRKLNFTQWMEFSLELSHDPPWSYDHDHDQRIGDLVVCFFFSVPNLQRQQTQSHHTHPIQTKYRHIAYIIIQRIKSQQ